MNDDIPAPILDAVRRAIAEHPDDLDEMIACAVRQATQTAEYRSFREALAARAIRDLVYDERHKTSRQIRRENGAYGGPAKVDRSASRAVQSVYDYFIAGLSLGMILGEQLGGIAEKERAIAEGHQFNARLCERLRPLVKDGERVRDAVKEAKLRLIFREVGKAK